MTEKYDEDNIDDLFKDALQNADRTPPLPVWEGIESQLDRDRRRRLWAWWVPVSVAASLMVFLFVARPLDRAAPGPRLHREMLPPAGGGHYQPGVSPATGAHSLPQADVPPAGQSQLALTDRSQLAHTGQSQLALTDRSHSRKLTPPQMGHDVSAHAG